MTKDTIKINTADAEARWQEYCRHSAPEYLEDSPSYQKAIELIALGVVAGAAIACFSIWAFLSIHNARFDTAEKPGFPGDNNTLAWSPGQPVPCKHGRTNQ